MSKPWPETLRRPSVTLFKPGRDLEDAAAGEVGVLLQFCASSATAVASRARGVGPTAQRGEGGDVAGGAINRVFAARMSG